jgi:hypothetical protein
MDPRSGMDKIRIWDPGYTSQIRNPQNCCLKSGMGKNGVADAGKYGRKIHGCKELKSE